MIYYLNKMHFNTSGNYFKYEYNAQRQTKWKDAKRYKMGRFYLMTLLEVDVSPILNKKKINVILLRLFIMNINLNDKMYC